ncbi:hypothetical protein LshimejAT787_0605570 [Lyophyllum shimeji]|uniref:SET domain-containing protein n=1 Tax=Lyophyllum shimeji TaxID=47721 RepID=A0A9P3PP03_LYOSH|nr:hypothetical protein LshimejAT787_0605570 [Lyophyllum shimeji]
MDLFDLPESALEGAAVDAQKLQNAIDVYRETWRQFYDWEDNECTRTIRECARPTTGTAFEITGDLLPFTVGEYKDEFHLTPPAGAAEEYFTVEEFDEDEECVRYATLICEHKTHVWVRPYPRYEACTPASYSHAMQFQHGETILSFIPYADDEEFPIERYLRGFELFSWQVDFADPDCGCGSLAYTDWVLTIASRRLNIDADEMIQLEATTRLVTLGSPLVDEAFSIAEVDATKLFRKLRIHRSSGLLWDAAQRDALWWSSLPGDPKIARDFVPKTADVYAHIDQEIRNFCPKLKCLHEPHKGLDPVKPKLRSDELKSAGRAECGNYCFRQVYREDLPIGPTRARAIWLLFAAKNASRSAPSLAGFHVQLTHRMIQIFAFRCSQFDDEDIEDARVPDVPPRITKPAFVDDYVDEFAELSWTAIANTASEAVDANSAVQYVGGAVIVAIRRRKASKARAKHPTPVDAAERAGSVNPMSASSATHGKKKRTRPCRNVGLQRGKFPTICVKTGSYGLGAFAIRQLPENTIIGGESTSIYFHDLADDPDTDPASIGSVSRSTRHSLWLLTLLMSPRSALVFACSHGIHAYTGLNYIFDLDPEKLLDAAKMGNETRYLNDSRDRPENNNVMAKTLLIDGDHRIALLTTKTVQANHELFLSYGDNYWNPPISQARNETLSDED